jgi:hypothetical protein
MTDSAGLGVWHRVERRAELTTGWRPGRIIRQAVANRRWSFSLPPHPMITAWTASSEGRLELFIARCRVDLDTNCEHSSAIAVREGSPVQIQKSSSVSTADSSAPLRACRGRGRVSQPLASSTASRRTRLRADAGADLPGPVALSGQLEFSPRADAQLARAGQRPARAGSTAGTRQPQSCTWPASGWSPWPETGSARSPGSIPRSRRTSGCP